MRIRAVFEGTTILEFLIHPKLIDEISLAKERRLNRFGAAVLDWRGKHR